MPGLGTVCRACGKSGDECTCLEQNQREELIALVIFGMFVVATVVASLCHILW